MALRHRILARITQAQEESSIKAETELMQRVSLSLLSFFHSLECAPDSSLARSFII